MRVPLALARPRWLVSRFTRITTHVRCSQRCGAVRGRSAQPRSEAQVWSYSIPSAGEPPVLSRACARAWPEIFITSYSTPSLRYLIEGLLDLLDVRFIWYWRCRNLLTIRNSSFRRQIFPRLLFRHPKPFIQPVSCMVCFRLHQGGIYKWRRQKISDQYQIHGTSPSIGQISTSAPSPQCRRHMYIVPKRLCREEWRHRHERTLLNFFIICYSIIYNYIVFHPCELWLTA